MAEGARTIVCIEDEFDMIQLIGLILERGGFRSIGALGGREGLETVRRVKPDLVLLDIMMPGMGGWAVHRQMKADDALKSIPIIVVTALGRSSAMARGLDINSVDGYVVKPFRPQELLQSIGEVLGVAG
jgi:DNA-binding response OmpR family regulator